MSIPKIYLTIPALALVTGVFSAVPAGAQSVVIAPAQVQSPSQVIIAPNAPPPPRIETIPPPPSEEARVMYWRPGHWAWDGMNWAWTPGTYVERPSAQAVWEPGHWVQQPSGGYVWVDGRWQG